MILDKKTVDLIKGQLAELKAHAHVYPDEIKVGVTLSNCGVRWDIDTVDNARNDEEYREFFIFYENYTAASPDECAAAVSNLTSDFLVAVIGYTVRSWKYSHGYNFNANRFIIAGLERLITLNL